jgi:hypothetical protein
MKIECEISLGELIDKISILKIKLHMIQDEQKQGHVQKELSVLNALLLKLNLPGIQSNLDELYETNLKLWKIEDDIRDKERAKEFDDRFIILARSVYVVNDERFKIKNKINTKFSSSLVEVKSYREY